MPPRRNRPPARTTMSRDTRQVAASVLLDATTPDPIFSGVIRLPVASILGEARVRILPASFVDSVRRFGVLTPLTVRLNITGNATSPDGYALLHGRRRLEAARRLNLQLVPVRVVTNYQALPPALMASLTVAENVHHDPSVEALVRAIAQANVGFPTIAECAQAFGMTPHEVQSHLLMASLDDTPWWVALREGRTEALVLRRIATGQYAPSVHHTIRRMLANGESVTSRAATGMQRAHTALSAAPRVEQTSFIDTAGPLPDAAAVFRDGAAVRLTTIDGSRTGRRALALDVMHGGREVSVRPMSFLLDVATPGGVARLELPGDATRHVYEQEVERFYRQLRQDFGEVAEQSAPDAASPLPRARPFDGAALDTMLQRGELSEWSRIVDALVMIRDAHPVEPDNDHDAFAAVLDGLCGRAARILAARRDGENAPGALDDEDRAANAPAPPRPSRAEVARTARDIVEVVAQEQPRAPRRPRRRRDASPEVDASTTPPTRGVVGGVEAPTPLDVRETIVDALLNGRVPATDARLGAIATRALQIVASRVEALVRHSAPDTPHPFLVDAACRTVRGDLEDAFSRDTIIAIVSIASCIERAVTRAFADIERIGWIAQEPQRDHAALTGEQQHDAAVRARLITRTQQEVERPRTASEVLNDRYVNLAARVERLASGSDELRTALARELRAGRVGFGTPPANAPSVMIPVPETPSSDEESRPTPAPE